MIGRGRVYDVWITFGSVHEVRAFRERKKRSLWFRGLVENCMAMEPISCVPMEWCVHPRAERCVIDLSGALVSAMSFATSRNLSLGIPVSFSTTSGVYLE